MLFKPADLWLQLAACTCYATIPSPTGPPYGLVSPKAAVSVIPASNTRPSPSKDGSYEATVAEATSKRSRIARMQSSTSPPSALPRVRTRWLGLPPPGRERRGLGARGPF